MSSQILFLVGLYVLGVFFGLLFKRQVPSDFIAITGFLWGVLGWVVGGMLLLVLGIPYTAASMAILFLLIGIVIGITHVRQGTWQLTHREWMGILSVALVFLLVLLLASHFNYAVASSDSIIFINTGRRIAYEGFSSGIIEELSLRGVFLPQLHSASVFLGEEYLYAVQPGFAITFILTFGYLCQRLVSSISGDKRLGLILTLVTSLALFSTYFIVFQFFYIHTNLISAVYLFLGVCSLWLASVEEQDFWMAVGVLALLGFSLARTEAPLFALIFLVLAISSGQIPYRVRLKTVLPFLGSLIVWYLYLLWRMGEGSYILNPARTMVIIGALLVLSLLVLVSDVKWIQRNLLPHLPRILLGCLVLVLLVLVLLRPQHMQTSLKVMVKNMLDAGRWGIAWILFPSLLLFSFTAPRVPGEALFFYGMASFFTLLLAIAYFREPYRVGWGDSANRMLTHILPVIILYGLLKIAKGWRVSPPNTAEDLSP